MRIEEGQAEFERAIVLSARDVARAKHYFVARVDSEPADAEMLIRMWWVFRKAPPVAQLILNVDYDFPDQCQRAANHWRERLSAAQALRELVRDGYIESANESQTRIERVNQGYTTVIERSGGTSGGWASEQFDVPHPARVRRGPFSKVWDQPVPPEDTESAAPLVGSAMAIRDQGICRDALAELEGIEAKLNALAEGNSLPDPSHDLLVDEALPLLRDLREVLGRVASNEIERLGFVRNSLVGIGRTAQALSAVGRFASGIDGLAKVPDILETGMRIVQSIAPHIG